MVSWACFSKENQLMASNETGQWWEQGGISSSVLSVFFTDKFYKLLKSLHLIGWEQISQWKTLDKMLDEMPPRLLWRRQMSNDHQNVWTIGKVCMKLSWTIATPCWLKHGQSVLLGTEGWIRSPSPGSWTMHQCGSLFQDKWAAGLSSLLGPGTMLQKRTALLSELKVAAKSLNQTYLHKILFHCLEFSNYSIFTQGNIVIHWLHTVCRVSYYDSLYMYTWQVYYLCVKVIIPHLHY